MKVTTEYIEKFGYRKYEGRTDPRWKRVWSLAWFELISTWRKSTIGKVILVIILALTFMGITFGASGVSTTINDIEDPDEREETIRSTLNGQVGSSLSLSHNIASSETFTGMGAFLLGFLIIGLFAIAGSGFFADDRQGHVIEIYLSKLQPFEYGLGKILAIIIYINLFLTAPLLVLGILYVQGLGLDHLHYLDYYAGIIVYGLLASLLLGLAVLLLSSLVEKRTYASLGFYLGYLTGSIFGGIVIDTNPANDFLLLISPSNLFSFLAYCCLGDFKLWSHSREEEILLNNGTGLEFYHVYSLTLFLIVITFLLLVFRLKRLAKAGF